MSLGNYYSTNNPFYTRNIGFRADTSGAPILSKPIEKVETVINNTVDTFVKTDGQEEEKKKSNKTAITVASSVLVLSGLVAVLNPKSSGKLITKLKTMAQKAGNKAKTDNSIKGKIYRGGAEVLNKGVKFLEFTNNINSAKDKGFKWLCTEKKTFDRIKSDKTRNFLVKADSGFRKVAVKPYEAVTRWFDMISKHTVKHKYKNVNSDMQSLDKIIEQYKNRLTGEEKKAFEAKLNEIKKTKEYFSNSQITKRLDNQEKLMDNLEPEFMKKFNSYIKGFKDKGTKNTEHINKNLTFWAEDIMMPERNKLEEEGAKVVNSLMGDMKSQKGAYNELIDIVSSHISKEEKTALEEALKKSAKKLRKANHSECVEYFDKKRDLILGSAPTDIVTAAAGIGLSGIAIGTADTKDERISRALTVAFPAIAGLGASMALTAMLFSGVKGMLIGSVASVGLSKIGSAADKYIVPKSPISQPQEVMNA